MHTVVREKILQAVGLLREHDIDLWVAQFGRETHAHPEPSQDLLVGLSITWNSAFLIARDGTTIALVATGDADEARRADCYQEVIPYVQGIGPELLKVLERLNPRSIALNYSIDDAAADGITHGMYLLWHQLLAGTPYADRTVSAGPMLAPLRARKLPIEVERIAAAVARTEPIFDRLERFLRPGVTEKQAYAFVTDLLREEHLEPGWDPAHCPHVAIGPNTAYGHAGPSDIAVEPGHLIFMDLGVSLDGYCSDLQRTFYVAHPGEDSSPPAVRACFETVRGALEAGAAALRPGVAHYQVDDAARGHLVAAGYAPPPFAFGHHVGQKAHDGGGTLGPRWERYGKTPELPVELGNVFALEFAVPCPEPGHGYVSIEENVLLEESGVRWLSNRQQELRVIRA
ncbi:MAG: M24 family metallopeptidase [Chloroflexota bacterium]